MSPAEEHQKKLIGRRQLLKAIAATGGAVAASTLLPSEWSPPGIEVGVLPAHAQGTGLAYIIACLAADNQGAPVVGPYSILATRAQIDGPTLGGITVRRTIMIPGFPNDVVTGPTDATGLFQPADFDLSPYGLVGGETITVLWDFVYPSEGAGTCQNSIDIVG